MKILEITLKVWKKDSGAYSLTPEIRCEFDPLHPTLDDFQKDTIMKALTSEFEALTAFIEHPRVGAIPINRSMPVKASEIPPRVAEPALPRAIDEEEEEDPALSPNAEADSPYDSKGRKWRNCPECGTTEVNKVSKPRKEGEAPRRYQACYTCRIFLQPDGSLKEMK